MDEIILKAATDWIVPILNKDQGFLTVFDLSNAFEAGAKWEASRHNSKCENNWQSLNAFKIAVIKNMEGAIPDSKLIEMLALVDQCLIENKPETI